MNNFITHHATFTPRKFISWTLIAALISQPVTASTSLAGSLSPTLSSASGERIKGSLTQLADAAPSINASGNATLIGSTLDSGNNLTVQGKNIVLLASVDQVAVQYSGGVSGKTKGSFASGQSLDERVTGSRLSAQGNIDLLAQVDERTDLNALPPTAAGSQITIEASKLKAGKDIKLQAQDIAIFAAQEIRSSQSQYTNIGGGVRQYQRQAESSTAIGSIVDAGNNLNIKSSGDTIIQGSALSAGTDASISTGGQLAMLAATSQSSEQINDFKQGRKKATTLTYSDNEVRQLLSTITVGNTLNIKVGSDFSADIGSTGPDGKPQADRMTVNGIEKGESRQQISITRTGKAGSDTATSEVRGKLSTQGIRAQANDSFAPGTTIQGQAAIEQYLASGLIQVKNNPQIQATLSAPTPNGSPLTYQDPSGKLQLSVAGQARAQEVYNQLKLTETFDVKKFADAQTAQIVTLVAAVVLTVMTAGAGATLIGAAAGTMSATVANAAFIGMVSTMTGQLVAGANFGDAFAAGIKSGAISAVSAGLTYGVNDALGLNAQIDATTGKAATVNDIVQYGNEAATAFKALPALDKLGNSLFWQQAGLNATAQGALTALQGGRFQDSFITSAASSVGSNFNSAVGDWAKTNGLTAGDFSKILLHAGIGAAQAGLTKQNVAAGAIGGATAELLSPLSDSLDAATGNKLAGELLTLGGAIAANQLLNGNADFASNLTAANQGLQTDRFNRRLHVNEIQAIKQRAKKLAGAEGLSAEQWEGRLGAQAKRQASWSTQDGKWDDTASAYLDQLKGQVGALPDAQGNYTVRAFQATPDQKLDDTLYASTLNEHAAFYQNAANSHYGRAAQVTNPQQDEAARAKAASRTKGAVVVAGGIVAAGVAPTAIAGCLSNPVACNQAGITAAELLAEGGIVAGGVVLGAKVGAKGVIPSGFSNADEFASFGNNVRTSLSRAGYNDVEPILQGSAVTGKSFSTGVAFDGGRVSDFDVALASSSLLKRAEELGIGLRSGGTRTGPLTARDLEALGLKDMANQMSKQAGRDVNFMIYQSSMAATQRSPSIPLPGKSR